MPHFSGQDCQPYPSWVIGQRQWTFRGAGCAAGSQQRPKKLIAKAPREPSTESMHSLTFQAPLEYIESPAARERAHQLESLFYTENPKAK